jgi:hypothetical protein
LLLEDDPAVRVESGGALVSRALWAAKLVASDGPMNVPNERRSVESDEETFMDRHGRSLHLVGRTCRMTRSVDHSLCDGAARTREPALSARAVGIDLAALGTIRIRRAVLVIAWRPSPAIC